MTNSACASLMHLAARTAPALSDAYGAEHRREQLAVHPGLVHQRDPDVFSRSGQALARAVPGRCDAEVGQQIVVTRDDGVGVHVGGHARPQGRHWHDGQRA